MSNKTLAAIVARKLIVTAAVVTAVVIIVKHVENKIEETNNA